MCTYQMPRRGPIEAVKHQLFSRQVTSASYCRSVPSKVAGPAGQTVEAPQTGLGKPMRRLMAFGEYSCLICRWRLVIDVPNHSSSPWS